MAEPRNVRFAPQTDFRTFEVMTPEPSPSFSTSTLESEGPGTPPRATYPLFETHPGSPASFTFIQNENQHPSLYKADERVMLDNVLVPSASQNRGVELWMDRHLFEGRMESLLGSRYVLDQPATVPPLQEMVITSEYLPPRKQLTITPSSSSSSAYVTVRDVFMGIRKELWRRTTNDEYRSLPQYRRDLAKQAYARRYQSVTGGPAVESQEKNDGIKYVDLLPDPQRFAGLYPGVNSQHWRLVLDLQPYPLQ